MSGQASLRPLRAVPAADAPEPEAHFCGHCGRHPAPVAGEDRPARVCQRCHLGLILSAPAQLAPTAEDPFLVIDRSLTVCAVSQRAERLLGVGETEAVHRHVTEFLVPADAAARGPANLVSAIAAAAGGDPEVHDVVVRPAGEFGVRLWLRIGPCGPPSAALLVLADGRL